MTLTIKRETHYLPSALEEKARILCEKHSLSATLEWKEEQYWLCSDIEKERPIGILVDRELKRHTDYFKANSVHNEIFARAVGIKGGHRPSVLDLTGGMLGDSLLLISMGCEVVTLERNPVVALLIESALARGTHPALSRLKFKFSEAKNYLNSNLIPEVIYFDPMFEDFNIKAAPKKEMRIFRTFLGSDLDAEEIFKEARTLNAKRLVVKRPRHSAPLGGVADVTYEGKSTRYDVYFARNMAESGQIS